MTKSIEPMSPLDPAQPVYGYQPAAFDDAPAVSVITPYYNTGLVFLETARSLLRQSLQNWQWIIINDGTTDAASLRVLLPFRSADSRITVIDQPNKGLPAARNAGVAHARALLLFFLDSDDLLAPTALEKLAWSLVSRPNSSFATAWQVGFGARHFLWPRGFETRSAFLTENMSSSQAMVRRAVFDQVGGFDETRRQGFEDYEFWLRCASQGFWGHDLREYLIWVRNKPLESYTSYRWSFQDDPQALDRFQTEMQGLYPKLFRNGLPRLAHGGGLMDTYALIESALPFTNRLVRPSKQRRILLLMPWIRMGGADRFALDLAAELVARGERVSVGLTREAEHTWMSELLAITPDVFDLPRLLAPADIPRFLSYLIDSRQISTVLISSSMLGYQLLPFLRAKHSNTAIIDYHHMEEEHWHAGGMPRAGLDHGAFIDMHITSSQHLAGWMIARGSEVARTRVCTTNIDPHQWQRHGAHSMAVRTELGIDAQTPVVLFPARLVAQKRPRLMAEIVRQLRDTGQPFVCLVAGDGEDRGWLERFVRQHQLQRQIQMLGAVSPERVRELMSTADVLLLPSEQEGIALALYEAMAMGVVPVAADVGGQRELVTPACGVLIAKSEHETQAYVEALRLLLAHPHLRHTMAASGRARISAHFSHAAMVDRMQTLFDEAGMLIRNDPQPRVTVEQAQAAATLAIEHYQLETRLRQLAPVRLALRLRQAPIPYANEVRTRLSFMVEQLDRRLYAFRRATMKRVRRLRKGHSDG